MSSSNAVSNRRSYFDKQIVFQRCMRQLVTTLMGSGYRSVDGSVTIPNHVNGSRNYLDSLLESGNQLEIFESGIIILCLFVFS